MPNCNSVEETAAVNRARQLIATYEDMAELIRLGAYRRGGDSAIDEAIHYYPALEAFLTQTINEFTDLDSCYRMLNEILDTSTPQQPEAAPQPVALQSTPVLKPIAAPPVGG